MTFWAASRAAFFVLAIGAAGTIAHTLAAESNGARPATVVPGDSSNATASFLNAASGYFNAREAVLTVRAIPGEIVVEDSIEPGDDHAMPFGTLLVGQERVEQITVRNDNATHDLIVENLGVWGASPSGSGAILSDASAANRGAAAGFSSM